MVATKGHRHLSGVVRLVLAIAALAIVLPVGAVAAAGGVTFGPAASYPVGAVPESIAIGDLNGDGRPDLAIADEYALAVSVLLNTGAGAFGPEDRLSVGTDTYLGSGPWTVVIADLNGDGRPDLAAAGSVPGSCCGGPPAFGYVAVFLGNGDGTFGSVTRFTVGDSAIGLAPGDLNGDGHPDLVVADTTGNRLAVLLGSGDGTFAPPMYSVAGSHPWGVVVGNLDGNGGPDIAFANQAGNSLSVLLGNGDGTFGTESRFVAGFNPFGVAVGDFNGDGKPDLAATSYFPGTVAVLLGNGDGTFGPATQFAVGPMPHGIAVGDLNGDGATDVAAGHDVGNSVSVLLGNGDGTFAPAIEQVVDPLLIDPAAVAIGDLNGDGKPELIAGSVGFANGHTAPWGEVATLLGALSVLPNTTLPSSVAFTTTPTATSGGTSTSQDAPFAWTAPHATECSLDGAAFAACSSPRTYHGLLPGAHALRVRTTGEASWAAWSWTIVGPGAPDTTLTTTPPMATTSRDAPFNWTSNQPGVRYQCKLDAGAFAACSPPRTYHGLALGMHTFAVRAINFAGEVDPTPAAFSWTIS